MTEIVYWLNYRLADKDTSAGSYDERWSALDTLVVSISENTWDATTSFYMFRSTVPILDILRGVKAVIDPRVDLAVVGVHGSPASFLIGGTAEEEASLRRLVASLKKF